MAKNRVPATPALRALGSLGIAHEPLPYRYEDRGGAPPAARELGVPLNEVVKTLVFEDEEKKPLLVLMPGDREVSTKNLARQLGRKSVSPCAPAAAERHTGYKVGGISPFGVRHPMPVYVDSSILGLDTICINAGRRGLLVRLSTADLLRGLTPVPVEAAQ